jgi:hypothetical protein
MIRAPDGRHIHNEIAGIARDRSGIAGIGQDISSPSISMYSLAMG